MGNYAASGGYYISCAASWIVAEPTTLTGSIGVFGIVPNIQKLLQNKMGIYTDGVKTNAHADVLSVFRPMDNYEKQHFQAQIDQIYATFLQRVAQGRNQSVAQIDSIGQGRVWSGIEAQKIGLVDSLGGINAAVACAAQKAGISGYTIQVYPQKTDWLTKLLEQTTEAKIRAELNARLGNAYIYAEHISTAMSLQGVQAIMPMRIIIE